MDTWGALRELCGEAYAWAGAQPLFVQVGLGAGLVLVSLYACAGLMGLVHLALSIDETYE